MPSVPLQSATSGISGSSVQSSASLSTGAPTMISVVSSMEASSSLSVPVDLQSTILPSSTESSIPMSTSAAVVQTVSSSVLALVSDNSSMLLSITPTVEISTSASVFPIDTSLISITESVTMVSSAVNTTDLTNATSATISTVPTSSAVPVTTPVPTTTQQPTTTENVVATYWIAIGDGNIEKAHHTKSGNMSHPIPETGQYSAEEEEELHNRREAERKKNKQRIREKRKREKAKKDDTGGDDTIKQYLAVQEEIDQVLDAPPPEGEIPDVFKTKSRKRSKKKGDKDGEDNEGFEEEPLTEAKKRMHKLLDDAFALISPTLSGAENDDREQLHPDKPEKQHEPMYINPSYMPNESPGLTTWSPYRASDQVALISMPKTMQTSLGNDDGKGGRRPVASLTENVPKSKMTTDPPKPIILRTRELIKEGQEVRKSGQNFVDSSKPYLNNGFGTHGEGTIDNLKSSHIGGRDKKSSKKSASGVEMRSLNGDLLANKVSQKHQAPNKRTPQGEDVTDVVSKSIHAGQTPDQTIRSVRNELQGMTHTDTGTPVVNTSASRKGRPPSGALVEIA
ncbi:hypothetical protein FSP39_004668 [Pinctada imbricata]|uniref:Uncharacterized protein n=1 Tax=Pinctada imbricata TaxID=66713 RepID=A0AA88YA89_PINIB|nr:hypothetical protein FSP39_004668 [Pinctada imbricata]